jgi:hypothetical protein
MIRTLFLAWQDPARRRWHPIGRLTSNGRRFVFVYTQGALDAHQIGRFTPLPMFPDLHAVYQSDQLFPLFANRLMRASRPDYPQYVQWLNLGEKDPTPLALLARSGGHRVTDTLEVFPSPEKLSDDTYETWFFLHGLRHMPKESAERAEKLMPGEPLLVMWDFQNPQDPDALALRSSEMFRGDVHLLGYTPRYLRGEIIKLMTTGDNPPSVTVEQVNTSPAPIQLRVLCKLRMRWTSDFRPFDTSDYTPMVHLNDELLEVA